MTYFSLSYPTAVIFKVCKNYNKVLLYSTGNYIQYPVINHNVK